MPCLYGRFVLTLSFDTRPITIETAKPKRRFIKTVAPEIRKQFQCDAFTQQQPRLKVGSIVNAGEGSSKCDVPGELIEFSFECERLVIGLRVESVRGRIKSARNLERRVGKCLQESYAGAGDLRMRRREPITNRSHSKENSIARLEHRI